MASGVPKQQEMVTVEVQKGFAQCALVPSVVVHGKQYFSMPMTIGDKLKFSIAGFLVDSTDRGSGVGCRFANFWKVLTRLYRRRISQSRIIVFLFACATLH